MMHNHREYRIGPALKAGDRTVLAIFRRTTTRWPGGCVGRCTPVVLVVMEAGECTVWQLDKNATLQEIEEELVAISESLTQDARSPLPSP
ncbi:MAG: hypothetical protein A4E37_01784 [Methanoregulaceae archaeon PtaB.Bin056]|jgi:hypothetical protein|nr:MAG: hypothetical protein A4E37_01784 [Methanoregulaceae archaeon PtaB.Bin056]